MTDTNPVGPEVDTAPAAFPEDCVLDGRLVRVEPLDPDRHGDALWRHSRGDENVGLWSYLGFGPFTDEAAFARHIESLATTRDPKFFAIVEKASGEALGHAAYMRIDAANRVIEIGNILLTPPLSRTAAATEAMYLMARHAFETLGYRRYEWKCNALNAPSIRAAKRLGFTYEGTFRQHMIVKGRSRDTAWFSITEDEWPAVRARFEAWLSPENFDARGRQRMRLGEAGR